MYHDSGSCEGIAQEKPLTCLASGLHLVIGTCSLAAAISIKNSSDSPGLLQAIL